MKITEANLVVIDCETTGFDYSAGDRVVEIAASDFWRGNEMQMLVHPGRSIPIEVSAVHHIVDRDVAEAPSLDEAYDTLDLWLPENAVLVAHNAVFDRSMLPSFEAYPWLCTRRLAQHLVPDAPAFKNQVLRYLFGGADLDLRGIAPHRAMADVIVTSFVFRRLLDIWFAQGGEDNIGALIARANAPYLIEKMPFGKHRGVAMRDLDDGYLSWMLRTIEASPENADLLFTVRAVLADRSGAMVSA